jgi:hypothetical protein
MNRSCSSNTSETRASRIMATKSQTAISII